MAIRGIFQKLRHGLSKTHKSITSGIRTIIPIGRKIDDDFLDNLEAVLIQADVGVDMVTRVIDDMKIKAKENKIWKSDDVLEFLKSDTKQILKRRQRALAAAPQKPTVFLVCGVNGTGKTTSIAKLAHHLKAGGANVLLAASDTFRAGATEQLSIWAERIGVDIIKHQMGADPAAVAFDAGDAAVARGVDYLIVDTAGRLHTKKNLMLEIEKIKRVLGKKIEGAPHEVLLVLDATTGQNAISQARLFNESLGVTGIFLAKLDGTAKGGIVLAINNQLDIPVKFIGIGEKQTDVEVFDPDSFVDVLFE